MESNLLLVASTVCGLRTPTPEPPFPRSRNPGKKDIAAFTALEAKFRALEPSTLPSSFRWLPSFRNPYTVREVHELVPAGVAELTGISARLRGRFPELFDKYRPSRSLRAPPPTTSSQLSTPV